MRPLPLVIRSARPLSGAVLRWLGGLLTVGSLLLPVQADGLLGVAGPAATAAELPAVRPGRPLRFPHDHGAHPDYRLEWWYLTGRLDDGAQTRGFQITFFRLRPRWQEGLGTPFAASQIVFAHAALAEPRAGRLLHAERRARAGFGQGAAEGDTDVRLGPWQLRRARAGGEQYQIEVRADRFAFRLRARPQGPPLLHGEAGYSRKGAAGERASYYYSRPQLHVDGELTVDGHVRPVRGRAWLDHEWSSALMPPEAVGWDWLGANMDDGGALMLFRMRDAAGNTIWAGGTRWHPGRPPRHFGPTEVIFTPLRRWRSSRTGIAYPVEQTARAGHELLRVRPLFDDQELDARASVGSVYWEGAVDVEYAGRRVGQGYLEMTGYDRPLRW